VRVDSCAGELRSAVPVTEHEQIAAEKPRSGFQPGHSGNPSGRPPGSRNKAKILSRLEETRVPRTVGGIDWDAILRRTADMPPIHSPFWRGRPVGSAAPNLSPGTTLRQEMRK
jgi:hypothetical protein